MFCPLFEWSRNRFQSRVSAVSVRQNGVHRINRPGNGKIGVIPTKAKITVRGVVGGSFVRNNCVIDERTKSVRKPFGYKKLLAVFSAQNGVYTLPKRR